MSMIIYALAGLKQGKVEAGPMIPFIATYLDSGLSASYVKGSIVGNQSTVDILGMEKTTVIDPITLESNETFILNVDPGFPIDIEVIANNEKDLVKIQDQVDKIRSVISSFSKSKDPNLFAERYKEARNIEQKMIDKLLSEVSTKKQ